MNLKELEALEAKTVRIVEALEAIEGEQRSCEEQAEVIDSHYGTLSELVERIDGVAKELQKVLSLLQRTDFGRTLDQIESQVSSVEVVASEALRAQDALDERSGRMESSVERVQAVCDAVEARDEMLAAALVAIQESLGSLDERLASLETAVGRIDRNTQKGLGIGRGEGQSGAASLLRGLGRRVRLSRGGYLLRLAQRHELAGAPALERRFGVRNRRGLRRARSASMRYSGGVHRIA